MKTLGAVLTQINKPLDIIELTLPPLLKGQVLVKVSYAGLCHSQLNEIKGKKGPDAYLPHTLGHEGSGIVINVGEGITKVKTGDKVVLTWIKGNGLDAKGAFYNSKLGIINSGPISTFMQHTVVSENRLVKIPDNFEMLDAALLGCAIPTGGGIVRHDMSVRKDSSIVIFGVGGIGLSALMVAKKMGANIIIAVDVHESKLKLASSYGATHTINAKNTNVLDVIFDITKGKGVDYALEAVGNSSVIEQSFNSIKQLGGLCVIAGNVPFGSKIQIDPYDLIKGKKIVGSWGGSSNPDIDILEYIKWISEDCMNVKKLITHQFDIHSINEAFEVLDKGQAGRIMLKF
jgi:S-(hydroxymethyl)glutathione dehydrogenase/alcohol dehydrogenase